MERLIYCIMGINLLKEQALGDYLLWRFQQMVNWNELFYLWW